MTALALIPVVPVAIEQVLGDMRFHFVLFFFFVALFVACIVFAIRVDARRESECFSIGRPLHDIHAGRDARPRMRFAAIQREKIDLRVAGT